MRKLTRRLFILLTLLLTFGTLLWSPPAAFCAGCDRPNQVVCISEALTDFQACCNLWGNAGCGTICITAMDEQYYGCMLLKGCPNPPPPQM